MTGLREKCLVIFIILTVIGVVQLSLIVSKRRGQSSNPCRRVYGVQWIRDPDNCDHYYICVAGRALKMPPCPRFYVWSNSGRNCVPENSRWNDCDPVMPANTTESSDFLLSQNIGFSAASDRMQALVQNTGPIEENTREAIKRVYPNHPCVFTKAESLLPHSVNCHWFFNCSIVPREEERVYFEPLTQECPYPNLFSIRKRKCMPYSDVDCGDRKIFKAPCEYTMNQCHQSPCLPCNVRYGSCLGKDDGNHPFPEREWTPKYIVCKSERTVKQMDCPEDSPIFSPRTNKCETLLDIPKQNGGTQPSCSGRHNGLFPDETGRCDFYFKCINESFVEYGTCTDGQVFDPVEQKCSQETAIAPCGNVTVDFCEGLEDGFYGDPFGRCTMYHHCRRGQMLGYMRCKYGSFSPLKGKCNFALKIPQPCGEVPNVCYSKRDGNYADIADHCMSYYRCHKHFVVNINRCRNGLVFNDASGKCDVVNHTPPPCGLAPSCLGKNNGSYPAPLRGCQYFYRCENEMFRGYAKCSLRQGGFYFNPLTRKCDFPTNICPPCGVKPNCSTSSQESDTSTSPKELRFSKDSQETDVSKLPNILSVHRVPQESRVSRAPHVPSFTKSPDVTDASKYLQQFSVSRAPIISSISKGPQESSLNKGPRVSSFNKDPKVSSVNKSSHVTAASKGPRVSNFSKEPLESIVNKSSDVTVASKSPHVPNFNKGKRVIGVTKGPHISSLNKAPKVSTVKGPQESIANKNAHITATSKGPQVSNFNKSPRVMSVTKAPQISNKAPKVSTVTKGSHEPSVNRGQRVADVTKGPMVSSVVKGQRVMGVTRSPQESSVNRGQRVADVTKGPKVSGVVKGQRVMGVTRSPQESSVSRGPHVFIFSKGSKVSVVTKGPRVTGGIKGSKVSSFGKGPRVSIVTRGPESRVNKGRQQSSFNRGPRVSTVNKNPRVSTLIKGPRVSTVNIGPRVSTVNKGPRVSTVKRGPKVSTVNKGSRVSTVNKGPRVSTVNKGSRVSTVNRGPRVSTVNKGPQVSKVSRGPQKPSFTKGPQEFIISTNLNKSNFSSNLQKSNFSKTLNKPRSQEPLTKVVVTRP